LILVDHIGSSSKPVLWFQKLVEPLSIRFGGDHLTRRPSLDVEQQGFEITERERFARGVVERLVAVKTA
ncbi:MAG: class I SAM-dependent methyltransferase, partial [Actinomycetes bacterium]